jgi:hypothetical protein
MKYRSRSVFFLLLLSACFGVPSRARSQSANSPAGAPGAARSSQETHPATAVVRIPGPIRSFLRMAAISQKISPEEVLPLLARNVAVEGYVFSGKHRKPTEYLVLLKRYVEQARELRALAGAGGVIRVSSCGEAQPLLTVLGYRLRDNCGPNTSVETADPERAFLTIDSGFPLTELEETLRGGKTFEYPFPAFQVPVLSSPGDWTGSDKNQSDLLDSLLRDPALARLYWALARIHGNTRAFLLQSSGVAKLVPLGPALDFYGSHIYIQSGRVVVPGGAAAESAWKDLVGASPASPAGFVTRLLAKDGGWLATYFDALARAGATQQAYFTESHHLQRFYEALRGRDIAPSPTTPVFRPNPGLLLLVSRLQLESNGQPHVPGNPEVWKEILRRKTDSKLVRGWVKHNNRWNDPEQLLEAMVAFSRVNSDYAPLQLYLTLSEIDRGRPPEQRLNPQTVRLLAEKFPRLGNQYLVFSEFRSLGNTSIASYITVADALDHTSNRVLRADALGIFQANVGIWQILARQGQISGAVGDVSWQRVVSPFARIVSAPQLYDATRTSLAELSRAANGKSHLSEDEIIALLAGPEQTDREGRQARQELANKMRSVMDSQRLVSLDTLLALGDGLNQMAQGKAGADRLIPLAGELREFQMPKPLFTPQERIEWTSGLFSNVHLQLEMRTDLNKIIKSSGSPSQLTAARGQLVPFLRDSLVGLNYAYYTPPAAQMIYNNPLFVRSHDFSGELTPGGEQAWRTPFLIGRGWAAGGGAHLAGSLADLPYILAQVEQDFTVPQNVQSLIWEDLVPCLITGAVLPRWWAVSRNELHAVTLYQRLGEELLTTAGQDEQLRQKVIRVLSDRLLPPRSERLEQVLSAGNREEALSLLAPAETFYLGAEFRRRFPEAKTDGAKTWQDLEELSQRDPEAVSWERLSKDFGVPHPALAQTYARELLSVRPFPTFMGYSSRLLAESWDSNNLYWARLADEMGYPPVALNSLVPELTHRMIEKIFATHLEDWSALLRALRETGDDFRLGKIAVLTRTSAASGL